MRHPEGQAGRSFETCNLELDLEEDQEVSSRAGREGHKREEQGEEYRKNAQRGHHCRKGDAH